KRSNWKAQHNSNGFGEEDERFERLANDKAGLCGQPSFIGTDKHCLAQTLSLSCVLHMFTSTNESEENSTDYSYSSDDSSSEGTATTDEETAPETERGSIQPDPNLDPFADTTNAGAGTGSRSSSGESDSESDSASSDSDDYYQAVDPKTGKNMYSVTPRTARGGRKAVLLSDEGGAPQTWRERAADPDALLTARITARLAGNITDRMETARSALYTSRSFQSTARSLKTARTIGVITARVGQLVVDRGFIGPITRKLKRDWKSFQSFREKGRKKRSYKTLAWFEERIQDIEAKELDEKAKLQRTRQLKWTALLRNDRKSQERRIAQKELREFYQTERQLEVDESLDIAKRRHKRLELHEEWGRENEAKNAERKRQNDEASEEARQAACTARVAHERATKWQRKLYVYHETQALTQATLGIMRKAGVLAGVNPPLPEEEDAPRETQTELLLRLKAVEPGAKPNRPVSQQGGKNRRGKKRSSGAFQVDLLHFHNLTHMRCLKIGSDGGRALSHDLQQGGCPQLQVLRLGWCLLDYRGLAAMVEAFASRTSRELHTLDLRVNNLSHSSLKILGDCVRKGSLPALRVIDLSGNMLGDRGGKVMAHQFFNGTWSKLTTIDVA
ncbi:unnamed protein product, partial [Chrysoparadoxa australica]